jgi:hypothetical protein
MAIFTTTYSRYDSQDYFIDENNRKRYPTFPRIDPTELRDESDLIIELKDGDRIDVLAAQYLGDGTYWWVICMYNNISLPVGREIYPGRKIRIPKDINKIISYIKKGTGDG